MPDPAAAPEATSEAGAMPGGENSSTEPAKPTQPTDELGPTGRRAIAELRRELKQAQQERDDLRDAGRSELEKAVARADKAERERDARIAEKDARIAELEHEQLARTAAAAAGIAEQWHRLRGTTIEELEADARALLESFGRGGDSGQGTVADFGAGPRPPAPATGSAGFSERIRAQRRR
jgi:chromosome segregation ATPase